MVEEHVVEVNRPDERQREVVHPDAAEHGDHRGDNLPAELEAGGQLEDVVRHPHRRDDHGATEDRPGRSGPGQEEDPGHESSEEDRQAPELGGGRLVQAALTGIVDGVDAPRHPLGDRNQEPGDREGHEEGVEAVDRVGSSVNEHRPRPEPASLVRRIARPTT